MAFNLCDRFPPAPKPFKLLEPGAYQKISSPLIRPNKVPFLSKSARNTGGGATIWTHALYDADLPPKIPNCIGFLSKNPRFPYEALSKEDIEAIICQCGIENPCECAIEEDKDEIICQGKVQRRLFKGPVPKSTLGEGLSAPSKRDHGFKILPNGTKIRIFKTIKEDCPPFYDARVNEFSAFYQGCKWSKWSSQRGKYNLETMPGPADYTIKCEPRYETQCAEKVRALKRKTSKQYRFIEIVQRRDILEGRPGPANYSPNLPKGTDLKLLGSRASRFSTNKYDVKPSPNEYFIKRDFDKVEPPLKPCHAKLPPPAFFGIRAVRFKPRREEGPSPASYDSYYRPCQSKYGNLVPFGSFSERFKEKITEDEESEDDIASEIAVTRDSDKPSTRKQLPMWGFRSKTIRMRPLLKKPNDPSPADLPQTTIKVTRPYQLQYNSPFFTSEGRFQPWFNWIPVHGKEKTPGPAYYCLDKPKCLPAVNCGPIYRTRRFPITHLQSPAPNAYQVQGGIENILATHNQKLKDNIANKHEFHWSPPVEPIKLSLEEQESALLNKSIALLDIQDIFEFKKIENKKSNPPKYKSNDTKLLRCFLHARQMPTYF